LYRSLRRAVRSKHRRPEGEPAVLADEAFMAKHGGETNGDSQEDLTGPN